MKWLVLNDMFSVASKAESNGYVCAPYNISLLIGKSAYIW